MRLKDREGKAMSWTRVLKLALGPGRQTEQAERVRFKEPEAHHLGERHVVFALRLVAKRLEVASLTPGQYANERYKLLEEKQRSQRQLYAELMPTVGQIERIVDGGNTAWDRALELAFLEPRQVLRQQRDLAQRGRRPESMPLVKAIHHYVEANGELPTKRRLLEFARLADLQVGEPRRDWSKHVEEAIAYRRTLGLEGPTELPGTTVSPGRPKPAVQVPIGGVPGTNPRRTHGQPKYSRMDCVTALRRFLEESAQRPTQANYAQFAQAFKLPAVSTIQRHGSFKELREEAQRTSRNPA